MKKLNFVSLAIWMGFGVAALSAQAQGAVPTPDETGQMALETVRCTANPDNRQKTLPQDGTGEAAPGGGVVEST
jgi:hypothetical protein